MLEVLYNKNTLEVRAWNADMEVTGNPDYIELEPPGDLATGIDEIKVRLELAGI